MIYRFLFISVLLLIFLSSCRKERFLTGPEARLEFSVDTLTFDTVFTTLGSTTKQIKVFNTHNQPVRISTVQLAGGQQSQFRMNVDGDPTTNTVDLEIPANDSIYIFVEVTVNPNDLNSPFVIHDSIMFNINGNRQRVVLNAWGQNAYYHYPDHFPENFPSYSIICDETWTNDKPHVIFGLAVVDSVCNLTIQPGTQIYLHAFSVLMVWHGGQLEILGNHENPVVFQGTRLEKFYDDIPGQWGGILVLRGALPTTVEYAEIKNAEIGLYLGYDLYTVQTNHFAPELAIKNTEIKYCSSVGLAAEASFVDAENLLIHSCGEYNLALLMGGSYNFRHSTIANFGTGFIEHKKPVVLMSNVLEKPYGFVVADFDVNFTNSILYGSLDDEIGMAENAAAAFNYVFDHCIIKTEKSTADNSKYINTLTNENPQFKDSSKGDFTLKDNSPAIDKGNPSVIVPVDLANKPRGTFPDIGAYEYHPD